MTDRWGFKPVALFLLVPVIAATAGLTAIVISPPFIGMSLGVREIDRRLEAAGADFDKIPKFPQRSTIYASDGTTVLARVYLDNREVVTLREIAPIAQRAVLAIEDAAFYEHGGVNVSSIVRAGLENLRAGEVVEGGSTITQQLVRQTLGLDPNDESLERKIREAALAMKVEQRYSKDRILAMYLNYMFFGNNVYGIGTASEYYFGHPARRLNLTEGALLAGLLNAPSLFDPIDEPEEALLRRNDVINAMMREGVVTPERAEKAKARPIVLSPKAGKPKRSVPPFIVSYVKDQIIEDPNGWYSTLGATPEARDRSLQEGGLDIVTTFDDEWQAAAQAAADEPWARTPYHPNKKPPADVGIASIDVETGAIRMMLSGKRYEEDRVNTVTTVHQPGSSFKPYILAAAFEQGIAPNATYSGVQGTIDDPRCQTQGEPWVVYNAEGYSHGSMDLWNATANSVNAVFARLILDVGPEKVVEVAQRMGVDSPLSPVCSLATGSVGISPLAQAAGYQTLANGGIHCESFAINEIRRNDQILYRHRPDCERAITKTIANLVTQMLEGVVTRGTAASVFSSGWGPWPVVGKTGTADDNRAVWFAGYTRQVATAVWVGSQGAPYDLDEYWGYDVFGGSVAAPIWKSYMLRVMDQYPAVNFPEPELRTVPSVVGLSEDEARRVLTEARFKVRSTVIGSYRPADTVADQSPAGGSSTIPGATVTIYVSNGVAPQASVPDVRKLSIADATALLRAANLFVAVVEETVEDAALEGRVIRQTPKPGTSIAEGSTVTISVGVLASEEGPPDGNNGNGGGNNGNGNGNGNGGGGD